MSDELATDLTCDPNNQPDDYLGGDVESIHANAAEILDNDEAYAEWTRWIESQQVPF